MRYKKQSHHFSTKNPGQSRRTVCACGGFRQASIWLSHVVSWFSAVHPGSFPATIRFKAGDHVRVKFGMPEKSSLNLVVTNVDV
jgi:hypothetical protein